MINDLILDYSSYSRVRRQACTLNFLISLKKRSTANIGVAYMIRVLLLMLYEIIDDIRIGQKILIFSTLRKILSLKEKTYLTSFSAINWYYF